MDLVKELVGLGLRIRLLVGEVGDPGVGLVHDRLELIRDRLVALGVRAGELHGARELVLALQSLSDRVIGGRGLGQASQERRDDQRDRGRASRACPPDPTSPSGLPGSSHAGRIVAPARAWGQGSSESHLARCARTDSRAPPPPTASARAKTLPTSCQTKVVPNESGRISMKLTMAFMTGPAATSTTAVAAIAPSAPTSIPSRMKGQRTNQSVAPTSFMISISSRRACTAMRIVFTITNRATISIIARTASPPNESTRVIVSSLSTTCGLSTTSLTTPFPISSRRAAVTRGASCA